MSKYDAFLTDIVYEIDDLVYDFYKTSTDLITKRKNQDKLVDFRDKTIATLNDMNVRSLEIISQFKKHDIVEERVNVLIQKNKSILDAALEVIESDTSSGTSVKDIYDSVYEGARKVIAKVNDPKTADKVKAAAAVGVEKVSEGIEIVKDKMNAVSEDPRFKEGVQKTKEVAKDLVAYSNDALKSSSAKLKEWIDSRSDASASTDFQSNDSATSDINDEGDKEHEKSNDL